VPFRDWFFQGIRPLEGPHAPPVHTAPWWQVMCLTGVDYFSTLGYQPGIAFLAAGALAPIATIVLVMLTLVGALPVYRRVAESSPNGQGSISMLEDLLPRWRGKAFVLVLLGFAATDFVITITLSAADATEHLIHNPFVPASLDHPVAVTLVLLALLGAVFLKGFKEAIGLAVVIVAVYLVLNVVIIAWGLQEILQHPEYLPRWSNALFVQHGSPMTMLLFALLVFPKLALGLSGFETGVAVMPLVQGDPNDTAAVPAGRIRSTKKLLRAAALIMSVLLIGSAIVTTLLIPTDEFQTGGHASGRALAYLAHEHLGLVFGTVYDISTIAILWFAGASAMAGLLNLVPRYLPRYGMAPEWTRATRPLVTLFTAITFLITVIFNASDFQCERRGAGGRVRNRRARSDDVGGRCRHAWTVEERAPRLDLLRGCHPSVRLHDHHQRNRASGWRKNRRVVHRDHRRHFAHLTRAAIDRAARPRRQGRSDGRAVPPRG
jgi:hypothetical protein